MATYSSVLIWRIPWTEWETTEAAEWRQHPFLWADAVSSRDTVIGSDQSLGPFGSASLQSIRPCPASMPDI